MIPSLASIGVLPSFPRRSTLHSHNRAQFHIPQPCLPSFLLSSHSHRPHHRRVLLRLTLSTQSQKRESIPFMADYLVSSFGFSLDRALKVSKDRCLAVIKSLDRPDSVVRFLKDIGLSDSQIKATISYDPLLLSCNVDKILKPRACDLEAAGFTGEILVQLVRYNPRVLELRNPVLRLQFWREFVGKNDQALLRIIRKNQSLFRCNIEGHVVPRLKVLREYGLSNQQIMSLLIRGAGVLLRSIDCLRQLLERARNLGFQPGSVNFVGGLRVVSVYRESTLNRKIAFFEKSFGWSEDDVYSAFRKYPTILSFSEVRVKSHMDFLTRKAMLDSKSIASHPILIGCSMALNLVPRHHVLTILKAHGLKKDYKLLTFCKMSEERFLHKCVVPHEKDVPGLGEAYTAARSRNVPP